MFIAVQHQKLKCLEFGESAVDVFLIGYPGEMGGANTEAWHTVKLWRRYGVEVHLIPT